MLNPAVFSDLRLIIQWVFRSLFVNIWSILTGTILCFVVVSWLIGHIIDFFKRFL